MSNQHHDITHALDKIQECARNLKQVACTVHTTDYRHNIFQLSYNAGRLSELTGEGRRIYDELKPEIASGLLNGWNTIENVIVPQWRAKFLDAPGGELDPDRPLYFAEYRVARKDSPNEADQVLVMERVAGVYYARLSGTHLCSGGDPNYAVILDEDGTALGTFRNGAADLTRRPVNPRYVDARDEVHTLELVAEPAPREIQLV